MAEGLFIMRLTAALIIAQKGLMIIAITLAKRFERHIEKKCKREGFCQKIQEERGEGCHNANSNIDAYLNLFAYFTKLLMIELGALKDYSSDDEQTLLVYIFMWKESLDGSNEE